MCKTVLEDSAWVEMHISGEEGRAFSLRILQCCLGEALGEAESGPGLARPVDGQLNVNVNTNAC